MRHFQTKELQTARQTLETAATENIVECCQRYLKLLDQYRDELYKYRGTPEINPAPNSLSAEAVAAARKAIRVELENNGSERNRTAALLRSLTAINGHEAQTVFNQHCYRGFSDWQLKAGGMNSGDSAVNRISVQEAVEIAGLLRRREYTNRKQKQL